MTLLRWIMAVAAASLLVAAAFHSGTVIPGPLDTAAYYETGIAVILVVGLVQTFVAPSAARWIGVVALAISLAGASVGLYLALRGLGPNTVPDIVYHVALVALLLIGLVVAWRVPPQSASLGRA
jgi:hypothetical protein